MRIYPPSLLKENKEEEKSNSEHLTCKRGMNVIVQWLSKLHALNLSHTRSITLFSSKIGAVITPSVQTCSGCVLPPPAASRNTANTSLHLLQKYNPLPCK